MKLPFTKMQAVGNDFVVVESADLPDEIDWSALAIRLCDRKFGVGSDGLLVVLPSSVADVRMRMFNPDGTEDMCGNGLRCVVRYARDRKIVQESEGVAESIDGLHRFDARGEEIEIEMAPPKFALDQIPVDLTPYPERYRAFAAGSHRCGLRLTAQSEIRKVCVVNTGSTHGLIVRSELPDDETFFRLSPLIENDPVFPERTSVLWAVVEKPGAIRLRIWERGVGETLGCGTGACASTLR